jgi:predicted CoA-binding protein
MAHSNPPDDQVRDLLIRATTIAVVGASSSRLRSSNGVMQRLQQAGYKVIPVNPNATEVLGERAYASLLDVPVPVDIVDVFRRAEYTPAIADDAVKIGAKALWLQQGVFSEEAAARAGRGGVVTIMDECLATMLAFLRVPVKTRRT